MNLHNFDNTMLVSKRQLVNAVGGYYGKNEEGGDDDDLDDDMLGFNQEEKKAKRDMLSVGRDIGAAMAAGGIGPGAGGSSSSSSSSSSAVAVANPAWQVGTGAGADGKAVAIKQESYRRENMKRSYVVVGGSKTRPQEQVKVPYSDADVEMIRNYGGEASMQLVRVLPGALFFSRSYLHMTHSYLAYP